MDILTLLRMTMKKKIMPRGGGGDDGNRDGMANIQESRITQPHPLLIPDVVLQVMSWLNFHDLRISRLVCKQWDEEGSKFLIQKSKIRLVTFEDVSEFIRVIKGSREKYVRFTFGQHVNLQDPLMQRFFNKFGNNITYLHLDSTHWIPASLRRLLFEKLPVLKELVLCSPRILENIRLFSNTSDSTAKLLSNLEVFRVDGEFESISNFQFIASLITVMPNLKVFSGLKHVKDGGSGSAPKFSKMGILHYEQWDNYTDLTLEDNDPDLFFSRLLLTRQMFKLQHLESLKVIFDIEAISILRQENYPLKNLEVVIPGQAFLSWHQRPTILHNYLLSLKKTLQALKLNYCSGKSKILTSFDSIGSLRNLRHLSLHRVYGTLDFLNSLPQLKTLYMTQEDFIGHYDEFHIDECRPHKLHTLKLYYTNWTASSVYSEVPRPAKILNVVQNIVQRFPNMKSFRMETLTDKALHVIYCSLPQLEELEATNGIFTSVGISGIPVMSQGQANCRRKQPFIGELQKLKSLRLESNKMTDFGILNGVVFLEKLEELTLLCYKITDESLLALSKKSNLKHLKTEFCYELSGEAVRIAKAEMKERCAVAIINPFCGSMEIEKIHDFLNENGPIHVSVPEFPVEHCV